MATVRLGQGRAAIAKPRAHVRCVLPFTRTHLCYVPMYQGHVQVPTLAGRTKWPLAAHVHLLGWEVRNLTQDNLELACTLAWQLAPLALSVRGLTIISRVRQKSAGVIYLHR